MVSWRLLFKGERKKEERRERDLQQFFGFALSLSVMSSSLSSSCIVFCRGLATEEAPALSFLCRDGDANDVFSVSKRRKKVSGPGFASELPSEKPWRFDKEGRGIAKARRRRCKTRRDPPFLVRLFLRLFFFSFSFLSPRFLLLSSLGTCFD